MMGRDKKAVAKLRESLAAHRKGREFGGEEWGTVDDVFRVLDQKATSMLTYLAILLAGVSVILVGGDPEGGLGWGSVSFLSLLFGMLFLSAFLCLSVSILKLAPRGGKEIQEGMLSIRMRDASGRVWRFQAAFWLTTASSVGFAVLVFTRMFGQYFN